MKLIIYTSIFLILSNFAFADIKVDKCDNIKDDRQKTSCLNKLKLQAIKENSKKKINIIEGKLAKTHKKIGKGVKKTEKGITNVAKKVQNTKKKIDEKGRKIRKNIDEKVSNFFKKRRNKIKEFNKRKK
ncbi:MAG: hypothetical protein CMI68_03335 [Candidatus Pelagibacter sp.]|nr:hypothetical protein [Candidatus Pelagibacter sp.]